MANGDHHTTALDPCYPYGSDLAAYCAGLKRIEPLRLAPPEVQPGYETASTDIVSIVGSVARAIEEFEFMSRKLYVGNLPYEIGENELQELFARAGSVESVTVMRDQATGRARGFAFVEMASDDEAQTAIRELNASQVGGRSLTVNEARPKAARSGGGGGFGGGQSQRRRSEPRW